MSPVVHVLDCATMCPGALAARLGLVDAHAPHLVARCLLIEGPGSLVLVDTGFGTADLADPRRLGPVRRLLGGRYDPAQPAVEQVRALGHDPADVRHVVVTHLDLDHAGGLGDFPGAAVHVHANELAAARRRRGEARLRYRPAHWEHGPHWRTHEPEGEAWFGFERARLVEDVGVELAMIPLLGHTAGHCGVAVAVDDGWLLHAGDAYLRRTELVDPDHVGRGLRAYHRMNSVDERGRRANLARLAELARTRADDVAICCSHDAVEAPTPIATR